MGALNAQTLRKSAPPAEFPPASYKGKQYVDSRGCIYIRAGIDGNVNWVPRVSRSRKQVCGYKPTGVAGARPTPAPKATVKPVIITATPAPVATPAPARVTAKTAPAVQPVTARPVPTTVVAQPKPARVVQPARVVRRVAPVQAPTKAPVQPPAAAASGNCSNASAFSQQFINKPNRRHKVRCGPQTEAPVTYGRGEDQSSIGVPSGTRVVQRHVFDRRQNTTNVTVPSGYRTVWKDDRLNPNRAERTLQPAQIVTGVTVPSGYRRVEDADGQLNPARGVRSAAGNAQTNQIWSNTVPRTLLQVPTAGQIVTVPAGSARVQVQQTTVKTTARTTVSRTARAVNLTSTAGIAGASVGQTSVGQIGGKRLFIRVATYASEDDARSVAKSLARRGLPMNLGHVKSSSNKVVLAGPFASKTQANAALAQVHGAGFRNARLNK